MSTRYQSFTRGDTQGFLAGDDRWIGIDSTRDRDKVQPGLLYRGENTRLRTGTVRQRGGTQIPQDFNPVAGFGNSLIGAGVFRDPQGREILLVAPYNANHTVALAFSRDPYEIAYSTTTNAATTQLNGVGLVEFSQSFDSLHMFRIPIRDGENLVWNGNAPNNDASRWQKTVLSADGRTLVPGAYVGEPRGDYPVTEQKRRDRDELADRVFHIPLNLFKPIYDPAL